MSHRYLMTLLGVLLVAVGLFERGWFLVAVWLGSDFLILAMAHAGGAHHLFGKRADGSLPWWSCLVFLPLLLYTLTVWHFLRLVSREPALNKVKEDLVVGRRLLPGELSGEFANYFDLTAEFPEPRALRRLKAYRSFPILDGAAPDPDALREAVAGLNPGKTFVHCAQGHGRTGLFALAILLQTGAAPTVPAGLQMLQAVRPRIRLSRIQRRCIDTFASRLAPAPVDHKASQSRP